jgi:hypothetical protein
MENQMNQAEPIFKAVFGQQWASLPLVFKKHYANRPFCGDVSTVEGRMDIDYSKLMSCLLPVFRLFHVLVPYKGKDVPVTVDYRSKVDSAAFYLDRLFYFPGKKPYHFCSHMKAIKNDEMIEVMRYGLGWRMRYFYDGSKVILQHKGYVLELCGMSIPLPLEWLLGKGHAEEEVIDESTFHVNMTMTHPLFGQMYRYTGTFKFKSLIS